MPQSPNGPESGVPDRDWLLGLATTLQTTLDVEELLRLFAQHAGSVVPHDSVEYQTPEKPSVRIGEPGIHSCSYDVVLPERNLGKITFTRDTRFSETETVALENILCNLVHPLRNALMYAAALEAASKDPLTSVNNRASLGALLERELELARRHETPLSVIILDVDSFKKINDTHGHLVGDCALKAIAACISSTIRESDIVFRYGGEEFVIVLSNTNVDGAVFLAERIRKAVEDMTVHCHDRKLHLTASLGVAGLDHDDDQGALLKKADSALYQSKARGRNRVTAPATNVHPLATQGPARGSPAAS